MSSWLPFEDAVDDAVGDAHVDPRSKEGPFLENLYGTLFAPLVRRATWPVKPGATLGDVGATIQRRRGGLQAD